MLKRRAPVSGCSYPRIRLISIFDVRLDEAEGEIQLAKRQPQKKGKPDRRIASEIFRGLRTKGECSRLVEILRSVSGRGGPMKGSVDGIADMEKTNLGTSIDMQIPRTRHQ